MEKVISLSHFYFVLFCFVLLTWHAGEKGWGDKMLFLLVVCLAIVIAVIVYEVIRKEITKHATLIVRSDAQSMTDQAMMASLPILVSNGILTKEEIDFGSSATVADVWGKGVMAFEYVLGSERLKATDLDEVSRQLNKQLKKFSEAQQTPHDKRAAEAFLVTDAWLYERQLHLDVAYILNDATYQYIYDLRKLGSK